MWTYNTHYYIQNIHNFQIKKIKWGGRGQHYYVVHPFEIGPIFTLVRGCVFGLV